VPSVAIPTSESKVITPASVYMLRLIDSRAGDCYHEYKAVGARRHMENTNSETNSTIDRAADYAREAADRVSDMGERVADNVRQMGRNVQSRMDEMEIDETTVPDAFRNVPKLISPRVHAWLDVAVSTYFLGLGVLFAIRGKGRAAAAAFINGSMVAGVSMLTDYDGDGKKPISFKMHGTMDAVQMTMAGLGPVMHGFAGEPEAKYFYGQAANELAVISTTDWDAGMPAASRRRAA
jgi:hypothetical protein